VCEEGSGALRSDLLPVVAPGRVDGFPGTRGRGWGGWRCVARLAALRETWQHGMRVCCCAGGRPVVAGVALRVLYGRPAGSACLRATRACNSDVPGDGFSRARRRRMFCMGAGRTGCAGLISQRRADHGNGPGRCPGSGGAICAARHANKRFRCEKRVPVESAREEDTSVITVVSVTPSTRCTQLQRRRVSWTIGVPTTAS
jgi:hypothetical protein